MTDCIFCKIAAGEFDTEFVYEDEHVVAFDDINPQVPVHTLIIPKAHYDSVGDNVPEDVLAKVFAAVAKVAKIKGVDESGYRIIANTGSDARQTVNHLHVHLLGGAVLPIRMGPAD